MKRKELGNKDGVDEIKLAVLDTLIEQVAEASKRHEMPMMVGADFGEHCAAVIIGSGVDSVLNMVVGALANCAVHDHRHAFEMGVNMMTLPKLVEERMSAEDPQYASTFMKGIMAGGLDAMKEMSKDMGSEDEDED